MKHYDYIFTGVGLSALMTVYRMVVSGNFRDKTILLIDENPKQTNDRTWCFWEQLDGNPGASELAQQFDSIVSASWSSALFSDATFRRNLDLKPYRYKMIRGLDFYHFVFDAISKETNTTFINQKVLGFSDAGNTVTVKTKSDTFSCNKLFNSIYNPESVLNQTKYPVLQQHFIGWFVKTRELVFNPHQATFMDFSVEQKGNTRFMYVLPFSETEALVEYTLFSKDLLAENEYENAIRDYLEKLGITHYEIVEKERGSIPMTSYKFWKKNTKNILHIGSAGGWTKASTGYTFKNAMKKSMALVNFLQQETDLRKFHETNRFWYYDVLLLDILSGHNERGHEIFSALFKSGKVALIFRFLDEETALSEDLQVILKCPKWLFGNAFFKRIFSL
jgi:lycopene beta-cyclase